MEHRAHNHSEDTTELLSAYLDNSLDSSERRRAEAFIERCAACARTLQEMRLLKQWLGAMPEVQPRRSFRLPVAAKPPRRLLFPTLRWATLAAAALLLVVLGVDTWVEIMPPQEQAASIQQAEPAAEMEPFSERTERAPDGTAPEADEPPSNAVPETESVAQASPAAGGEAAEEGAPAAGATAATTPTQEPMATALEAPAEQAQDEAADSTASEAESAAAATDPLEIAVVVLVVVTLALGAGAAWAQFRHI